MNMKCFLFFKLKLCIFVVLFMSSDFALGKECTNTPTQLSSHTFRHDLLASNNETWKKEMFSHYHLTPTDDSAWDSLLPRKHLKDKDIYDWSMMYKKMKSSGYYNVPGGLLKEIPLSDVRLNLDSIHGRAQQTNLDYLLMLDVNRLVWSFRKTAGLPTPGNFHGGWESPNTELRGHFVGHYLSASAQMWASTYNDALKVKMTAVVNALSECQEKMGSGYLSAFPSELFDRFEAIKPVWAPYYTIHKIMAGLLDQHIFANNTQALKMVTWMVNYFYGRVQNVISTKTIEHHWLTLNEETGGMNDVLYKLYSITGDERHLELAHLFDKPCFLGVLAVQADDIAGFHSNTHIPIVVGAQRRYEVTGDPLYKEIGTFFMDIVNSSHSYATGGTSVSEFWSDPKRLATTLGTENEESCTTYNMLKVSRHLFQWTKEIAYADYYERALTNGVLSIQRGTDPGIMIYMLPLGRGVSKAVSYHGWGTHFDSFWCCYGTGIESFSKLGDSIYFEEEGDVPGIYIIQYISSSLNWDSGKISLDQKVEPLVSWNNHLRVNVTISSIEKGASTKSTLNLRIPFWTQSEGAKAVLNGKDLPLPAPGNFLPITKEWSAGDTITLDLPVSIRTEPITDDRPKFAKLQAILYGPYLLAGLMSNGSSDAIKEPASDPAWISPIPPEYNSRLITLGQESEMSAFVLCNSENSIKLESLPEPGSDYSVHATFRLILNDSTSSRLSSAKDVIGNSVMLEPFDLPGMVVAPEADGQSLGVTHDVRAASFRVVSGGKKDTISLESESQKGCFVYGDPNFKLHATIKLNCSSNPPDEGFKVAASFTLRYGISQYNPISFVVKGAERNFVLQPLLGLRDEHYSVYFNFQPKMWV